jgi:hypothetical protein
VEVEPVAQEDLCKTKPRRCEEEKERLNESADMACMQIQGTMQAGEANQER